MRIHRQLFTFVACALLAASAFAAGPAIGPVSLDFILFGLVLAGVALMHHHALKVAVIGAVVIAVYKIAIAGFKTGPGMDGFIGHLGHEWVLLANLLCLLVGFALLSDHFEQSRVPKVMPHYLPDDWKGGFVLLILVFVLSAFLDNIAAALIGGTVASAVYRKKVHIGFLAAIVAASNAGGSGSVVGDTTTTMLWLAGASPLAVLDAYVAAGTALVFMGFFAARQQQAFAPIIKDAKVAHRIDWTRLAIVLWILGVAIIANVLVNTQFGSLGEHFPVLGVAVWAAILIAVPLRKPNWGLIPEAAKGALFLLSLVLCASMMPVDELPKASWPTVLGLGFLSAVFDNIPLTELAIKQGGYDWGMLAYCVGFGGSMLWFGSSAGVALSSQFPEARNAIAWVKGGWHVVVAYVIGFAVMLVLTGWHPTPLKAVSALMMPIAA
jgi:Na+/H+ antiporter NhaD/arsenite permease-like protein